MSPPRSPSRSRRRRWPLRSPGIGLGAPLAMAERRGAPIALARSTPSPTGQRAEALRLVSALFEDGRRARLRRAPAPRRPRARPGRRSDRLRTPRRARGDVTEALLSTEYDADGPPRRIGLELWTDPDVAPAARGRRSRAARPWTADGCAAMQFADVVSARRRRRRRPLRGSPPARPDDADQRRDLRLRRRADDAAAGLVRARSRTRPGSTPERLGRAMQRIAERDGEHPLYELERGRITETDFLGGTSDASSPSSSGHEPELHRFSEIYFEALDAEPADDRADARLQRPRATGWPCSPTTCASGSRCGARCSRLTRSSR